MAPTGEIAITLSKEEAQALKQELHELSSEKRTPRAELLDSILQKIRIAEERML